MNFIDFIVLAAVLAGLIWALRKLRQQRRTRRLLTQEGNSQQDYGLRTQWSRSDGKVNVSSFIYFDVDRDGQYSMSDRPLGGIHVRLYKEERHVRRAQSNINGFANFTSSTKRRNAPIQKPGRYKFAVSVPPGWVCTSGNQEQTAVFNTIPGSPAGIGAEEMMKPVGLAPIRLVRGTYASDKPAKLAIMSGKDKLEDHALKPGETFQAELPEIADAITLTDEHSHCRMPIGPYPIELGTIADIGLMMDDKTPTRLIDFDDHTIGGLKKIPNGYAGLNWFNLNIMSRDFTPDCHGYANGTTSGDHACYTSSGHPAEIYHEKGFGLRSMLLTNAWPQSAGETVTIECWNDDRLLRQDAIIVTSLTPVSYTPMMERATRVRIASAHYWQIVIDDIAVGR